MRIGLIIADFEMSFTTSFKHTARVKYNVDFTSSNVSDIRDKIQQHKENLQNENHNNVHVGYSITVQHVEHVESLFNAIVSRYAEVFSIKTLPKKIYTLINQLREAETPTPAQIAREVVTEILAPPNNQKLYPKEQLKADADAVSKQRALNLIRKIVLKKEFRWHFPSETP